MSKQCFKCGEVKNLSCFYKHQQMKDGYVNKCKDCNRKDARENRRKNIEYYREYDRKRGARRSSEVIVSYRLKYPMKYAAHTLVNNPLRDGRLTKSYICEICGKDHWHVQAHHDDYALPLQVRWLCPPCHYAWHQKNGMAKNSA